MKTISYVYDEELYLTHKDWEEVKKDNVDAIAKVIKVYSSWGKKIDAVCWFDYLKRLQDGVIKPGILRRLFLNTPS